MKLIGSSTVREREEAIKGWIINLAAHEYSTPYMAHRLNVNYLLVLIVSPKGLLVDWTERIRLRKH